MLREFSNSQQRLVERQRAMGGRVNPANSGMTCREHSAVTRGVEIRCEQCQLVKPSDDFSAGRRRDGDYVRPLHMLDSKVLIVLTLSRSADDVSRGMKRRSPK